MIKGENISLRTARQGDLDTLYAFHCDLGNRGHYFPLNLRSEPDYRKAFQESGFWSVERGTLLIVNKSDDVLGYVNFYPTVPYLDELELGYLVYDPANRRKGIATEALDLFVNYLFANKKVNRLRLVIHVDNKASRGLAEKCGFSYEATARGAWYHQGENQDVAIYVLLRGEAPGLTG
jgi:RimJ/RimL family protein N-acetyltransferase